MPTILGAAASGMIHNQQIIDSVGHNVANVNTAAFKKTNAINQGAPEPAIPPQGGRLGVAETNTRLLFAAGAPQATGDPLHFAISDDGFFALREADGSTVFTRVGLLGVDADGNVAALGGRQLDPPVTLPDGYTNAAIQPNGVITAANPAGEREQVGQLTLVRFTNPEGLIHLGDGLYAPSDNSGEMTTGTPGDGAFAGLTPGALEGSNVDLAEELTTMIIAQRAYQASLKSFQVGDEMLALATRLTR